MHRRLLTGGNNAALSQVAALNFETRADKVTHLVQNLKSLTAVSQKNALRGGQGNTFYNTIISAWKEAGIVPVFAIGNGAACGTASSPGDQEVIAAGSTTSADALAESSSSGPSVEGRLKPDLTAPGVLIRSAWGTSDSAYETISGTSMAAPHVAGAATLLLSRNPNLTYAEVKELLQNNADRDLQDTGAECGGIPSTEFPNNQYGYGRINVRRALEAAINA
ncbi:Serine protease AprX [Orchesella cincta]|uniref:Serine protease AprX n=1 Tax=Orchesella cincta TaxID=48709 RepID=A0A1D2MYA8_ORCCI|nr:Serine protease AprX [Orchesella cincta]